MFWLTRRHGLDDLGRPFRWRIASATTALEAARVHTETSKQMAIKNNIKCRTYASGVDVVPQRDYAVGLLEISIDTKAEDNELRDKCRGSAVAGDEFSKLWDWSKLQHVRL